MHNLYNTKKVKKQNSKGVKIPEEKILCPRTADILLEKTSEGILINPSPIVPPLNEWAEILADANTSSEREFEDWDITLNDGEHEEKL